MPLPRGLSHDDNPPRFMVEVMVINDVDWERVKAAYERGRAMYRRVLKGLTDESLTEDRVRADLNRLARCLAKCDEQTLRLLEVHMIDQKCVDDGPWFTEGMLAGYVSSAREQLTHKGGRPTGYACREAVAVLSDFYDGSYQKIRGAKVDVTNGGSAFNPYITWLGEYLMLVEDEVLSKGERRMSLNEACLAAWNATPPAARPRKRRTSPSQHQGAGPSD